MAKINSHFTRLSNNYLFAEVEKRKNDFLSKNPTKQLINLGIGDVIFPLSKKITSAISEAIKEQEKKELFKGYGPSQGYLFLREKIAQEEYRNISPEEIFISHGIKNDISSIAELFSTESKVAILDPTYPVYYDAAIIAGRTELFRIPAIEKENFLPSPPPFPCDLIYLCSPNNPTGVAFPKEKLKEWVDFARENRAIILFDAAYKAFITSKQIPRSIYEIEGAKEVAIEFCSFSKTAGFTNLRCSYTVIPKTLKGYHHKKTISLNSLWKRRQDTKFGGVPHHIQQGAFTTYFPEVKKEIHKNIKNYQEAASLLKQKFQEKGYTIFGGKDSPYLWCKAPSGYSSWEFFDLLLSQGIISVPGIGFGKYGDGYVRISSFTPKETTKKVF